MAKRLDRLPGDPADQTRIDVGRPVPEGERRTRAAPGSHNADAAATDLHTVPTPDALERGEVVEDSRGTMGEAPRDPQRRLCRGEAVGRYLVLGLLGEGGMAAVYSAYDPELSRKVAIKLLKLAGEDVEEARATLVREAKAMARLSHPNVVPIYDIGTFEGQIFAAMELVDGPTLGAWLRKKQRRSRDILQAFLAAGEGLAAAHAAGLVHRDFKPDNVLMGRDGRVRVTDFGLAHLESRGGALLVHAASSRVTTDGEITGTPAYMAPEQFAGELTDHRTDQFSFCAALWEALTGQLPYGDGQYDEIRRLVLGGRLLAPARALPGWLQRALEKGLSKSPHQRFPSMKALLLILRRDRARRFRRAFYPTVSAAVLAAVAAALLSHQYSELTRCTRTARASGDELWGTVQRGGVQKALKGAPGVPAGEVLDELDGKVSQYVALRTSACQALDHGDATRAPVLECLERYRIDAAVAVQTFAQPQAVGETGKVLLDRLGPPERCLAMRPPPGQAGDVTALRMEAAEVGVLLDLGRPAEAIKRARGLIPKARTQAVLDVAASLEQRLAEAQLVSVGAQPEVLQTLHQAVRDADASGDEEQSVRTRIALFSALSESFGRHSDADSVALDAEAWLKRLGSPAHLELLFLSSRGAVLGRLSRHAESIASYRRAIDLGEKTHASFSDRAGAHNDLAIELSQLGRFSEACHELEEALELMTKSSWRPAVDLFQIGVNLGVMRSRVGRSVEALAAIDEAWVMVLPFKSQIEPLRQWADAHRGRLLEDLGRADEAAALFQSVLDSSKDLDPATRARALAGRARILIAQGQVDAALAAAEEAVSLEKDPRNLSSDMADVRFALAQALWATGGDRPRALNLAKEALAAYAGPEDGFRRGQIEAWLADHKPTASPGTQVIARGLPKVMRSKKH